MPLDPIARQYADTLFNRDLERITREYQQRDVSIRRDFAARNVMHSGPCISALSNSLGDRIQALATAKQDALLKSYQRAGIPFDDTALSEISQEVRQFCEIQANHATNSVQNLVNQMFP